MTKRTLRNVLIGIFAFIALAFVAVIVVVQTDWFRNYVRKTIVASTEESTGGKVDIGTFDFDVRHLRAVITNFVIHGTEPATAAPLLRAARLELDIRLFNSIHQLFDISYLGIDRPQANVMVMPDGRTNIPTPKTQAQSDKSGLATVVDLAIGRFELTNGLAVIDSRPQALNIQANNLRAQLFYSVLTQGYQGQLALEPVYVASGRNTPVNFRITLPLTIVRDRIDIRNGAVATPVSALAINASVENMKSPKITARLNGHIATIDLQNAAGLPLAVNAKNVPGELELDANATASNDIVDVTGLRATLGHTNIEASGRLKDAKGAGALQFKTQLALGELGRLAKVSVNPEGTVLLNGTAKLDAANAYNVTGNIQAKNVSFVQSGQRISNIDLVSALTVDPHNIDLNGLRLSALGGEFAGNVALQDFERYKVQGNLRNLDLQNVLRAAGQKLPYDGVISGPIEARGDTKAAGTKGIAANARLTIAPGRRGIPVSGRLNADYSGDTDNVAIKDSYVALPHTRLTLSGSVGKKLDVALTSRDLNDLLAAANLKGPPPVVLDSNGEADFAGAVTGSLAAPRIDGHLAVNRFSAEGRAFNALAADVVASSNNAAIRNGSLTRGAMRADFAANVGLRNWAAPPRAPLTATASIANGDLADVMALAGEPPAGYTGALTATAQIDGTVGNPLGVANLQVANGTLANEPFDRIQARVNLGDGLVTVPAAFLESGAGRVDLTAEFHHPRDSFTTGQVHAHVQSTALNLARLRSVQQQQPNSSGTLQLNADVNGTLTPAEFLLTGVTADTSGRGLRFEGRNYGEFTATARTAGQTVNYNVTSDFAGSNIRVTGNTQLIHDYPTTADASIANLPIERMLVLAKQSAIPARGNLSGTAHVTGTLADPQGTADLNLVKAVIYDEPLDRVHARVTYLAQSVDVPEFEIVEGPSRIDLTAHYDHPAGNLNQGNARFNVTSSHIDLARIHNVQKLRPGLGGAVDMNASGAATVKEAVKAGDPTILFSGLNANVGATGITAQGRNLGDLKLTANTTAGNRLNFALDSNLTGAAIHGSGNAQLTGDYPVNAQVTFSNVSWSRLQPLIGTVADGQPLTFEAGTDGQVTVNGPLLKTDQLNGSLNLAKLYLTTLPKPGAGKSITIANQGPIAATLDHGTVRIAGAHLTGPQTDVQLTGTASLTTQMLNLGVNANLDLSVLRNFDRDLYSSGAIVVATTVRGTLSQPAMNGQATLKNASFNYAGVGNGISNANGVVVFSGNNARIQNLTAESGGGKINVTGFAGLGSPMRFGMRAGVSNVRVRVQQGVSATADADIRLTGTTDGSIASGTVTVQQVTYAPQSDIGSMLSRAAPPVQSPTTPSAVLDAMKLDVHVVTAPGMTVQASLAENLQATADLRVRGTASEPGVLGRVTINEGQLVFFGAQYTVDTGTISFYNPLRIDPILDVSLETQAKGVNVVLHVTGPVDNMNLSYTSDPPLQFQEIVSLLASGKTPTSDPTTLANQPSTPAQSYQQMGESAIVGKALADPVSSRLQRVFGVTQLKIDPSFTSGSDVPTARLTLQQRISSNITFTYVSAIDDPNSTIIRIEWAFNPQYSAVATRDQNGIFSVNFFYKRQFR